MRIYFEQYLFFFIGLWLLASGISGEAGLVDCVVNRTLIPKIANIKIGRKKPSEYLAIIKNQNPHLDLDIESHLIPNEIINGKFDKKFKDFIEIRATKIYSLIQKYTEEKRQIFLENYNNKL